MECLERSESLQKGTYFEKLRSAFNYRKLERLVHLTVIILCIGLIGSLFLSIAKNDVKEDKPENGITYPTGSNVIGFIDVTTYRLTIYEYLLDFEDQYYEDGLEKDHNLNLKFFMIYDDKSVNLAPRIAIYLSAVFSLLALLIPLFLLILTIRDIFRIHLSSMFRKIFFFTAIIALLLMVLTSFYSAVPGLGLILYLTLSILGLLFSCFYDFVIKQKDFNLKKLLINSLSILLMVSLVIIGKDVFTFVSDHPLSVNNQEQNFSFFYIVISSIFNKGITFEAIITHTSFIPSLSAVTEQFTWIKYVATFIPIFITISLIFVLLTYSIELAKILKFGNFRDNFIYPILSAIFTILGLISTIIFLSGYNSYITETGREFLSLSINSGIIIYSSFSILTATYYVLKKILTKKGISI